MSEHRFSARQQLAFGLVLGWFYGLICRLTVRSSAKATASVWYGIMTCSFIFLVPLALGFVVVWFGEVEKRWLRRIFGPWLAGLLFLAAALAFNLEGWICVILWLPLVLIMSSLGGILAGLILDAKAKAGSKRLCLAVVVLLPFFAGPLESLRERSSEIRTVHTTIEIKATPAQVWRQIRSVPRITEAEHGFSLSHKLGFPRPTEAIL
ncbi:MAG: hypothetical protein EBQ59_09360, partial [Verrucomicrobia bacterium]|nr:hypothetical protein [Verrucomicrobiota bacterium]